MADVTIGGIATSVTLLASADLFECEQGGVTKKTTAVRIQEFCSDKGADTASAGTLVLGDGDYFHITGTTTITDIDFTDSWDGRRATLVFDSACQITHNATTLQCPGDVNIKTSAGDIVRVFVDSGDNVIVTDHTQGEVTGDMWIRQGAARNLTSSTSEQKLFDSVTNGTLTLPTGVFFFESLISLSAMSGTSGNAAFDILGAGTAVLSEVLYQASAGELAINTVGAGTIVNVNQGQTPAAITTAGTGTVLQIIATGTFEVSTAGTIIPSITLLTAAAATVAAGTYFRVHRVGPVNAVSGGPWT